LVKVKYAVLAGGLIGPVLDAHGKMTPGDFSSHPLDYYLEDSSDSDEIMADLSNDDTTSNESTLQY